MVAFAFDIQRAFELLARNGFVVTPYSVDFKSRGLDLTPKDFIPSAHALKDVELAFREFMDRAFYQMLGFPELQP